MNSKYFIYAHRSSCCYVIEQMGYSVSGLLEVFSPHHAMVGRECAKRKKEKEKTHTHARTINASLIWIIIINRQQWGQNIGHCNLTDFALNGFLWALLSTLCRSEKAHLMVEAVLLSQKDCMTTRENIAKHSKNGCCTVACFHLSRCQRGIKTPEGMERPSLLYRH